MNYNYNYNCFFQGASDAMSFHNLTELSFEFTSHVRDQVTHGTCPNLSKPSQVPTKRHLAFWMALENVESRGKIYNVQELKYLFV